MESNFYLEFKKSKIAKTVWLEFLPIFKLRKLEKKLFLFLSLFFSLFYIFIFEKKILGALILSFLFFIISLLKDAFFEKKLKNPPKTGEIFDLIDFSIAKAIYNCLRLKNTNSSFFLYFLLDEKNFKIRFLFSRLFLNLRELKNRLLEDKRKDDEIKEIIFELSNQKKEKISPGDLFVLLSKKNIIFKNFLIENQIKTEDIQQVWQWVEYLEQEFLERKKFWKFENLLRFGSLAREWTAGYTILLDRFSTDVTKIMKKQGFRRIFAHAEEVETMEKILISPEKNDVLIVGEPGSGRRSMIEFLANKCALGQSLPELNFKRVVILDLPKIIAETQTIEEAEMVLDKIFSEVLFAGNVILVIDNLHQYVGVKTERTVGAIEISGILGNYVTSPNFWCIGITTFEGLHKNLEKVPLLLEAFEKIEVKEVSLQETLLILEDRALRLEKKYKIFFTFLAIKKIIELCEKYMPAMPFPEKAIEVLDESAILVSQRKQKTVLPGDVEKVIERRTKIPVGEMSEIERKTLLNLEKLLHERIVDQEEAIKEISDALRRAMAELKLRKGPIGCFLFLGPTGVGKTETAKALAEIYYGSEKNMIRLDMSEFQNISDIKRILGWEGGEGLLTTPVRERPFSLILLDEFEKAHPNILNLFLQVFDEGHLTDGMGRRVDFKNTIIVATSNAGYQIILDALKDPTLKEWGSVKKKLLDFVFEKGIFRPELINRFDAVVVFKPLSRENLLEVAELQLRKIQKQLAQKDIDFIITQELKEKIVDLSYDITFGARNMQRVIQDKVANVIARAILANELKRGSRVKIDPETFSLIINP